ncbi:MAG TPA: PH domain-containing protein [Limnochordales bacterium]|nr:PH domain-containing protein [Limnochordales bacterium]
MGAHPVHRGEQVFRPRTVRSPWATVLAVVTVAVCLLPLGLYLYYGLVHSRLHYRVGPGGLTVEMGVGRIWIPAAEVAAVDRWEGPGPAVRVVGAGLRGLQMGWYRMGGRRVYRMTTAGRNLVYVDTAPDAATARPGTRYVLSPADPDRFVTLLRAAQAGEWAAAGAGGDVVFDPVPGPGVLTDPFLIVVLAFTLSIAIGFPWVLSSGIRGMHFRVGPDGIAVHHLGRQLFRWESIRRVERLDQPPRLWRIFGAHLPGYYAGLFSAGPLGRVRVYGTTLRPPLILLETSRGRVILEPADAEAFLAAVQAYR